MTLGFLDSLNFAAFIIGLTSAIIILSRWKRSSAYLFLAGFVFTYCSGAILSVFFRGGVFEQFPFLIYFPFDYGIFAMAFLFAFLTRLSGTYSRFKIGLLFLIPIVVTLTNFYFWMIPVDVKVGHLDDGTWQKIRLGYRITEYVFTAAMIIISLVTVKRYQEQVDQNYSEGLPKGFGWVKTICYYLLFFLLAGMVPSSMFSDNFYLIIACALTGLNIALVIWTVMEGLNQDYIYVTAKFEDDRSKENKGKTNMAPKSALLVQIIKEIEEKELYRSTHLNLNELAGTLSISPRKLSNLINNEAGKNFRNFINGFRVEYSKKQLNNGILETMNMKGLALDSGFRSRTTFYTAFKQDVGKTPLEFLAANSKKKYQ